MRLIRQSAALAGLLALAAMPAALAADQAAVAVYSGGVDFAPNEAYSRAVLTVSGNGGSHRYELAPGERISIGMFDPDGQLLADGVYSWELELLPTAAEAARLRALADSEGFEPRSAQSGSFAVRDGLIADPALVEVQERTAAGPRSGAPDAALAASSFGAARAAAEDSDAAAGSRTGAEARLNAAAASRAPAAGGLGQPDRVAGEDSDAAAAARGRSLEPPSEHQLSAQPSGLAPRPRSDGSNGRPRS